VLVPAKREAQGREGRAPMVNLADSQEAERLVRLSASRGNRSAERKRERKKHRHQGHDKFPLIVVAAPEEKLPGRFSMLETPRCPESFRELARRIVSSYKSSAICTAFKAAPLSN
jgi:hypothetical protein